MRVISVLTGSRAEYGLLRPVITAIKEHPSLKLHLIVCGMHLSKEFGYSLRCIKEDGFEVSAKVKMNPMADTGSSMADSIGRGIIAFTKLTEQSRPDFFIVLGDRHEALAGAVSASYMNIPVAHIHGGDSARAGLDESARHAITKLAHIHFPATRKSAGRIIKMGEDHWRVFVVGSPALDSIVNTNLLSRQELKRKFGIDNKPFILLVQHSVTTEPERAEEQMKETLEAIKEIGLNTIVIYPNSDAGGRDIIRQINAYCESDFIMSFRNLPRNEYLSFLKHASVLVGNSSSGMIESSSYKTPVVNIGIRQEGRQRSHNVIDVDHNKDEIVQAVKTALYDETFRRRVKRCKNPYGDGKAGYNIVNILNEVPINKRLLQKKIVY